MSIANTQSKTIIEAGIIENNDQVQARIEHLKALENIVGNSYPNKFERSRITGAEDLISNILTFAPITEVIKKIKEHISTLKEGERPAPEVKEALNVKLKALGNVRMSGRLAVPPRVMGKAAFVHLSDGKQRLQIYVRKQDVVAINNDTGKPIDEEGKAWEVFALLDHGDFVGVEGYLFLTNTGELSVHVETLQFLSKSLLPMPDKMHGIADPELRRRYRYADLIADSLKIDHEADELTTREVFERRAKLISGLRRFLDDNGFIEVETPMLTPKATGAAARAFETFHEALKIPLYARIAPELYLKRLTVGGFEKVYELNRNFRNEGINATHNPEFTMLEFYCAYMDSEGMMDFTEALIKESVLKANNEKLQVEINGVSEPIDFSKFNRFSMKEIILQRQEQIIADLPQIDEVKSLIQNPNWIEDKMFICILAPYLQSVENKKDFNKNYLLLVKFIDGEWKTKDFHKINDTEEIERHKNENWTEPVKTQHREPLDIVIENQKRNWKHYEEKFKGKEISEVEYGNAITQIFDVKVEKELKNPTFITDYPKSISPLSKASPENPNVAERFELFINGMECANGFSELNDPQEQFERFRDQMKERETGDEEAMIMDEDYIRALSYGMPPAAGIGIGIDRLVMLLTNCHSIRDVILFPHMRPEKRDAGTEGHGEAEK